MECSRIPECFDTKTSQFFRARWRIRGNIYVNSKPCGVSPSKSLFIWSRSAGRLAYLIRMISPRSCFPIKIFISANGMKNPMWTHGNIRLARRDMQTSRQAGSYEQVLKSITNLINLKLEYFKPIMTFYTSHVIHQTFFSFLKMVSG
jgi:hypothetical protein